MKKVWIENLLEIHFYVVVAEASSIYYIQRPSPQTHLLTASLAHITVCSEARLSVCLSVINL